MHEIAVNLLSGNLEWARLQIWELYRRLFESKASVPQQRRALRYAIILDPEDHRQNRFLGECWAKEEGRGSTKALHCFETACNLRRDFPPYVANLGWTMLARGEEGAGAFLSKLQLLEQDCPQAINGHVRLIGSDCLNLCGKEDQAAALRMEKIGAGSRDATFYADEAKARLEAGDATGALGILVLVEKNGCANDYTTAIQASALRRNDAN